MAKTLLSKTITVTTGGQRFPAMMAPDWSEMSSFEKMKEGTMKGYYAWGMNPCHSAPNSGNVRRSMANCDWVVVVDQVITETASFWDAAQSITPRKSAPRVLPALRSYL